MKHHKELHLNSYVFWGFFILLFLISVLIIYLPFSFSNLVTYLGILLHSFENVNCFKVQRLRCNSFVCNHLRYRYTTEHKSHQENNQNDESSVHHKYTCLAQALNEHLADVLHTEKWRLGTTMISLRVKDCLICYHNQPLNISVYSNTEVS